MRFLLATGIYPPEAGGPATVVADLARELKARGHDVEVVTYGDGSGPEALRVSRRGNALARYWRFRSAVRLLLQPDTIVFATDVFSVGIPVRLALLGRANAFILRLGGEWCWEDAVNRGELITLRQYWGQNDTFRRKLMRWNYRWILKRAKRIIVTSDLLSEIVSRIVSSVSQRLVTVPNIASSSLPRSQPTNPTGSLRLSYVGRFAPVKNVPFLASVLKRLHEERISFDAVLAGDGPEWEQVRSMLAGVPEVSLPGRVSHEEGMRLLCESDLHVLPSLSDICPNSVAEALACGVPCVITSQHGLPAPLSGVIELDPQDENAWVKTLTDLAHDRSRVAALRAETRPVEGRGSLADAVLNV